MQNVMKAAREGMVLNSPAYIQRLMRRGQEEEVCPETGVDLQGIAQGALMVAGGIAAIAQGLVQIDHCLSEGVPSRDDW